MTAKPFLREFTAARIVVPSATTSRRPTSGAACHARPLRSGAGALSSLSLLGPFVLALVVMRLFSRTAMGKSFVLEEAETGFLSAPTASDLVGRTGEALTDLRPAGKIIIEGKRHEATSERAFIARGARVRVIGTEGPALVVRPEEDA